MKIRKLYLILLLSVLTASCGAEENGGEDSRTDAPSRASERSETPESPRPPSDGERVVLFLGNSLSAGLGVDEEAAFPHLIQQKIDSLGWGFQVVNAGISGETSSGGLGRIDWVLKQPLNVLVLELGGNDGLRGIATEVTRRNLEQIIGRTQQAFPDAEIVLAGMQIPPNLGHDYTRNFRDIYPTIAEEHDVHLIPFLLEGVGGVDSLMQSDGIHPNARGHRVVAENVWEVLKPVLEESLELEAEPPV